jgi:hypothetical protein
MTFGAPAIQLVGGCSPVAWQRANREIGFQWPFSARTP